MIAQYTAAALVARMRMAAIPSAGQGLPTCNGTEDVVSACASAAHRLREQVGLAETVAAIELLCAFEALDLRGDAPPVAIRSARDRLRGRVGSYADDRPLSEAIAATRATQHALVDAATVAPPAPDLRSLRGA